MMSGELAQGEQKQTAKRGLLMVAVVALLAMSIAYLASKKPKLRTGTEKGDAAPAFKLSRYGGGTVSLEELRGKVVMLDFWATWCVPCAVEMPTLTRLAREYEPRGFVFL